MKFIAEGVVVAGIDGSESAVGAAGWAAAEAVRRRLSLRLVHVFTVPTERVPFSIATVGMVRDGLRSRGVEWLAEARKAVSDRWPDLSVEVVALESAAVPALIRESTGATMVVLGSRGLGGFTGLLLGSTAVALAGHGHCPVVVVRGQVRVEAPVVVGTDGSPAAEAAVGFAFEEASSRGARLVVVRTWNVLATDGPMRPHPMWLDSAGIENEERRALGIQLAGWLDKYPEVPVEQVVTKGRPVRVLLEHGAGARLLVVGCRGRGGFQGMVLGSTSQALIVHADCPVAVIRSGKL